MTRTLSVKTTQTRQQQKQDKKPQDNKEDKSKPPAKPQDKFQDKEENWMNNHRAMCELYKHIVGGTKIQQVWNTDTRSDAMQQEWLVIPLG